MVRAWQADELAHVTIKNRLSSLRKLAIALNTLGWNATPLEGLVPDELYQGLRRSAPRGSSSSADADQIIALLATHPRGGTDAQRFARLLRCAGLQREEAAGLREQDLDRTAGAVWVSGANAKGGRARRVDLADDQHGREQFLAALNAIPVGRNWLWTDGDRLARDVEEAIRAICEAEGIVAKGQHGLHATFAEDFLRRQLAAGVVEDGARDALAQLLGHNRRSVTYQYVPRLTPRPARRKRLVEA